MRVLTTTSGVLLLMTALVLIGCGDRAAPPDPEVSSYENVIFILVDTLRADRLEASRNGRSVMPKLREHAGESWYFKKAVSQGSWTKPAMVSIFTSLYPEAHNVNFLVTNTNYNNPVTTNIIPDSLETMAQYMKSHQYATAAIQSNAVMMDIGADHGFDSYFFESYPEFTANEVTDKAIKTMADLSGPFFLYVHYTDPHAPYQPPPAYQKLFGPLPEISESDSELLATWNNYYMDRVMFEIGLNTERQHGDLSDAARERLRMLYDGESRFIDDEVSRLIRRVREQHPNSLIILTADHGEELWEHGTVGHGKTVYEEVVHVPLIISAPGQAPRAIDTPVETIDILPTIAGHLGFEPRACWQGKNLFGPAATASAAAERVAYSQNRSSHKSTGIDQKSALSGDMKLIEYRHLGQTALYDLSEDPLEKKDLSNEKQDTLRRLQESLNTHLTAIENSGTCSAEALEEQLNREMEDLVGALGYVQ